MLRGKTENQWKFDHEGTSESKISGRNEPPFLPLLKTYIFSKFSLVDVFVRGSWRSENCLYQGWQRVNMKIIF